MAVREIFMRKTAPKLLVSLVLGTAIFSTPAQAQSPVESLPNGNYLFCSNPPTTNQVSNERMENAGHCFIFRKSGNSIVGRYYDAETYGEVNLCLSGTLSNSTLTGEGVELIGSLGRQSTPPSEEGLQLVNWDNQSYLRVARARVIRRYEPSDRDVLRPGSRTVHYRRALLNLSGFHRYKLAEGVPPTTCMASPDLLDK
jgi:hypothetical protein